MSISFAIVVDSSVSILFLKEIQVASEHFAYLYDA